MEITVVAGFCKDKKYFVLFLKNLLKNSLKNDMLMTNILGDQSK